MVLRRDRERRRGGGVALYVRSSLQSSVWNFSGDNRTYELLWAHIGHTFVGVLYHPPRSLYTADSLLDHIEACLNELFCKYPATSVVLAAYFNQLDDNSVIERTGFVQLVQQATCSQNILHRIVVSGPRYKSVRIITPYCTVTTKL